MKALRILLGFTVSFVIGAWAGYRLAHLRAETALIAGPASDNYPPALAAISEAKEKLASGDTNVLEQLQTAQDQIEKAQEWTRRFLGQPEGGANGRQPFSSQTDRTSAATPRGLEWITPARLGSEADHHAAPQEITQAKARLRSLKPNMSDDQVFAALGLARCYAYATGNGPPKRYRFSYDLLHGHGLDIVHDCTTSPAITVTSVSLDDAIWKPGEDD